MAHRRKKGSPETSRQPVRVFNRLIHPFDWCVACRWGTLAVVLTALYIFTEITSPVSVDLLANMVASIMAVALIICLFLTASRARQVIRESM